jgi:transcriptional regulator with XRE-family HTH domain
VPCDHLAMPEIENTSRRRRMLACLTLDELAQLVGISKSALSKSETGREPLSVQRQESVDRALRRALAQHALEVCDELDAVTPENGSPLKTPASSSQSG